MPAQRSRGPRRIESEGQRLVWTLPVEPTDISGISFAPNITPFSFNDDPPPLVDAPPSEIIMFSPSDDNPSASRRPTHSKKKPGNHIPRPPNAFILFRSSFIKSQHVSTEVETNHSTLSKIIGLTWQNLSEKERQVWHNKAKAALEEHKRRFPQYAFKPSQSKKGGTVEKRKVREVEPKDMKRCAKIAELLAAGLKGQELEAAMVEFDKHHVPEVVTRFEAPITATAYRRSSSAPIPDTENSKSNQSFFSTVANPKQIRASSTRPPRRPTPEIRNSGSLDETLPKTEFLFDFTSFSFDKAVSPVPTFACDPLVDPLSPSTTDSFALHPDTLPIPLDTDLTYFLGEWNQCVTPTTPDYLRSPSPSPLPGAYGTFSDNIEENITIPNIEENIPTAFSSYHQCGFEAGLPNETYLSRDLDPSPFCYPTDLTPLEDIDFSALLNLISDPQYQI